MSNASWEQIVSGKEGFFFEMSSCWSACWIIAELLHHSINDTIIGFHISTKTYKRLGLRFLRMLQPVGDCGNPGILQLRHRSLVERRHGKLRCSRSPYDCEPINMEWGQHLTGKLKQFAHSVEIIRNGTESTVVNPGRWEGSVSL